MKLKEYNVGVSVLSIEWHTIKAKNETDAESKVWYDKEILKTDYLDQQVDTIEEIKG